MKPLLRTSKTSVDTSDINLLEEGKVVTEPSAVFNDYFQSYDH